MILEIECYPAFWAVSGYADTYIQLFATIDPSVFKKEISLAYKDKTVVFRKIANRNDSWQIYSSVDARLNVRLFIWNDSQQMVDWCVKHYSKDQTARRPLRTGMTEPFRRMVEPEQLHMIDDRIRGV